MGIGAEQSRDRQPGVFPRHVLSELELPKEISQKIARLAGADELSRQSEKIALFGAARALSKGLTREKIDKGFLTEVGAKHRWSDASSWVRKRDVQVFMATIEGKSLREFAAHISQNMPLPELAAICLGEGVKSRTVTRDQLMAEQQFRKSLLIYASKEKDNLRNPNQLALLEEDVSILNTLLRGPAAVVRKKAMRTSELSAGELAILKELSSDPDNVHTKGAWTGHPDWKKIAVLFMKRTGRRETSVRLMHHNRHHNISDADKERNAIAASEKHARNREKRESKKLTNVEMASRYPDSFPSLKKHPETGELFFDGITGKEKQRLGIIKRGYIPWSDKEENRLTEICKDSVHWRVTVRAKRERLSLKSVAEALNQEFGNNRTNKQLQLKLATLGIKTYK